MKRVLAENFVRPDEAEKIKSLIREKGTYKVIDKVTVELNEKRDVYEAQLFSLGIKGIVVPTSTVKQYEKLLVGGIWALVTLEYFFEEGAEWFTVLAASAQAYPDAEHGHGRAAGGSQAVRQRAVGSTCCSGHQAWSLRPWTRGPSGTCWRG